MWADTHTVNILIVQLHMSKLGTRFQNFYYYYCSQRNNVLVKDVFDKLLQYLDKWQYVCDKTLLCTIKVIAKNVVNMNTHLNNMQTVVSLTCHDKHSKLP
jgi:hypothetical protein